MEVAVEDRPSAGYYRGMESKNAEFLRQGLIETCRKMTPAQRIRVFIEHSERMNRLRDAGVARRKALEDRKKDHG